MTAFEKANIFSAPVLSISGDWRICVFVFLEEVGVGFASDAFGLALIGGEVSTRGEVTLLIRGFHR